MEIDAKLYKEFLIGNMDSFNRLIEKYRGDVVNFIKGYVKNIDVAEDLAQDVFVYILINKKEYDFKYSMKTYLFTIARSRAINYLKREKRVVSLDENIDYFVNKEYVSQIENMIIIEDKKSKVQEAIKSLNDNQQRMIFLSDIEGLSHKDISKITNKTIPQIKMTIYRARKNIKRLLREEGINNE